MSPTSIVQHVGSSILLLIVLQEKSIAVYRTEFKDVRCTEEVKQVEVAYLQPFLVEQQSLPSHPHPAQPLTLPSYSFLTL